MDIRVMNTGIVCPLGDGIDAVFAQVLEQVCGKRALSRFGASAFSQAEGGELPPHLVEKYEESECGPVLAMLLDAARQAVPAGMPPGCGLILGTNFGGQDLLEWAWRERIDTGEMDEETFMTAQHVLAHAATALSASGPTAQLSMSCASGAAVVSLAKAWLESGRVERVLCLAYDVLTEFCWAGLSNLRTISEDALRPFDGERSGTIFGEAAVALLLEKEETAAPGGVYVVGSATNNNAFHMTAPPARAAGSRRAMEACLLQAGVQGKEVSAISAHATGTRANDKTESEAVVDLLGGPVPLMALKGNLCHLLGAAGLAEIAIAQRAMIEGLVPGVCGLRSVDDSLAVDVEPATRRRRLELVLTNSAGIGGNNGSVCLSQRARVRLPSPTCGVELAGIGWFLPGVGAGRGETLPAGNLVQGTLRTVDAKPHLGTVRGYLDPSGAFALAALNQCRAATDDASSGIVGATCYGGATTGFTFYRQVVEKGPRLASPLLFPHSYASAPANLAAIECGAAGPHCVFYTGPALQEAFVFARHILSTGQATRMYVLAYEGACAEATPDDWAVLPGAICWRLERSDTDSWARPDCVAPTRSGVIADALRLT